MNINKNLENKFSASFNWYLMFVYVEQKLLTWYKLSLDVLLKQSVLCLYIHCRKLFTEVYNSYTIIID